MFVHGNIINIDINGFTANVHEFIVCKYLPSNPNIPNDHVYTIDDMEGSERAVNAIITEMYHGFTGSHILQLMDIKSEELPNYIDDDEDEDSYSMTRHDHTSPDFVFAVYFINKYIDKKERREFNSTFGDLISEYDKYYISDKGREILTRYIEECCGVITKLPDEYDIIIYDDDEKLALSGMSSVKIVGHAFHEVLGKMNANFCEVHGMDPIVFDVLFG